MTKPLGFLIERDGRTLFLREMVEWALADENYKVTPLVSGAQEDIVEQQEPAPSLPNTDDTQERMQLMNELFDLQQQEIDQLKHRLEGFVEVIEGIIDLTEVVSQNNIENRSKLLVISKSCKEILKPNE